ncbi:hypothetical protein Tco_0435840 [Tanacetum coccineum]
MIGFKLINQLEIYGEVISQEDANLKFLRSLPSAWNNIALIMHNKADLDGLSMDGLYNNLKVYEAEIKSQSSSSSNSQNVAFVSSDDTSSTNEAVNTALDVPVARSKGQASSSTYVDDVMFSFFVNQSNSCHAYHEGEEIFKEDKKKSEFQWAPKNQGNRNGDAPRTIIPVETPANALVVQDGIDDGVVLGMVMTSGCGWWCWWFGDGCVVVGVAVVRWWCGGDDDVDFEEMMVRVTREMVVRVAWGYDGRGGVAEIRPERW